jgi:hypothetical protein
LASPVRPDCSFPEWALSLAVRSQRTPRSAANPGDARHRRIEDVARAHNDALAGLLSGQSPEFGVSECGSSAPTRQLGRQPARVPAPRKGNDHGGYRHRRP